MCTHKNRRHHSTGRTFIYLLIFYIFIKSLSLVQFFGNTFRQYSSFSYIRSFYINSSKNRTRLSAAFYTPNLSIPVRLHKCCSFLTEELAAILFVLEYLAPLRTLFPTPSKLSSLSLTHISKSLDSMQCPHIPLLFQFTPTLCILYVDPKPHRHSEQVGGPSCQNCRNTPSSR